MTRAGSVTSGSPTTSRTRDTLNLVSVDSGDGCVAPSAETIQAGDYALLSRPLFMYPSAQAIADNGAVGPFMQFTVDNYDTIAEAALIVPMDVRRPARRSPPSRARSARGDRGRPNRIQERWKPAHR